MAGHGPADRLVAVGDPERMGKDKRPQDDTQQNHTCDRHRCGPGPRSDPSASVELRRHAKQRSQGVRRRHRSRARRPRRLDFRLASPQAESETSMTAASCTSAFLHESAEILTRAD
jgi:hypothetical protein